MVRDILHSESERKQSRNAKGDGIMEKLGGRGRDDTTRDQGGKAIDGEGGGVVDKYKEDKERHEDVIEYSSHNEQTAACCEDCSNLLL